MDLKGLLTFVEGFDEKKIAEERWEKCKDCPLLTLKTSRCSECGCFMKVKVKLKKAECPVGNW